MPQTKILLSILLSLVIAGIAFVAMVALRYSYSPLTGAESAVGLILLFLTGGFFWFTRLRSLQRRSAMLLGIILGLLWVIEISINNFIAPPLPARDIIDNIFWGAIALSILVFTIVRAYRSGSFLLAVEGATWSGLVSGLLACCMALFVIVFAMDFIIHDPLNVAEWAARGAGNLASSMAAYFAFETFAGAFLHLVVLGVGMGGILGIVGAMLGKGIKTVQKVLLQRA
jgi:hypothetical protein